VIYLLKEIDKPIDPTIPIDRQLSYKTGTFSVVVRASSEASARELVYSQEREYDLQNSEHDKWLDPSLTSCRVVEPYGEPEVILTEYVAP